MMYICIYIYIRIYFFFCKINSTPAAKHMSKFYSITPQTQMLELKKQMWGFTLK